MNPLLLIFVLLGASLGTELESVVSSQKAIPADVREAMVTVLRQHEDENEWLGRSGEIVFALGAQPISQSARGDLTRMEIQLQNDLLLTKNILDAFAARRLDDATTLKKALLIARHQLKAGGKSQGAQWKVFIREKSIFGWAFVNENQLQSRLFEPENFEQIQLAYRDCAHENARNLMASGKWEDALRFWFHLHDRKLTSPGLYLDAARCFTELKRSDEALEVLREAVRVFASLQDDQFFELAGNLFEELGQNDDAERAYEKACEILEK